MSRRQSRNKSQTVVSPGRVHWDATDDDIRDTAWPIEALPPILDDPVRSFVPPDVLPPDFLTPSPGTRIASPRRFLSSIDTRRPKVVRSPVLGRPSGPVTYRRQPSTVPWYAGPGLRSPVFRVGVPTLSAWRRCARRYQRKQVLFALKVSGRRRSPGRGGSYRRTAFSQLSCW